MLKFRVFPSFSINYMAFLFRQQLPTSVSRMLSKNNGRLQINGRRLRTVEWKALQLELR
jgi:hypothetical protein